MFTPKRISALMVMLLLVAAVSASASTGFVNPPTFTPQRTILWGFSDPATWSTPVTTLGPTWDQGDWVCDDIIVTGGVQWIDTDPNWPGRQGMIGIVNNTQAALSGSVTFHINNYANLNRFKLMCMEYEWRGIPGSSIGTQINVPAGFQVTSGHWDYGYLYPGERVDWTGRIEMNPPWEEVRFTFEAQPGAAVLMDNFYVATQCVPEPSSLLALSGGLVGLLGVIRRKKS